MTVKVQGIFLTCLHLPHVPTLDSDQGGESSRIKEIKRIWEKLDKKGLWKGGDLKQIFAGDFNSLTLEDQDEEGWARVGEKRAAKNLELDKALSLSKKVQELANASEGESPEAKRSLTKFQLNLLLPSKVSVSNLGKF